MIRRWQAAMDMRRELASIEVFGEAHRILRDEARKDNVDPDSFAFTVEAHEDLSLLVARASGRESEASALRHVFTADVWREI